MKVSIVTPSRNQGAFIGRTLRSVTGQTGIQTGIRIEHIVYDGLSSDDTVPVLKQYTHNIRWVSERDRGQAHAVNKGIRATDGDIIGWLNSDDIYYPGAVARVVRYFDRHPKTDLVYGMADHIDVHDRPFEPYPTEPWNFDRLKSRCFICQPAVFLRRRVVDRYGLLDESLNFCMDYEYWLRLGKAGARFGYLEEKLAGSRLYDDNKTLGARLAVHGEINDMLKYTFGRVPVRWLVNFAHAAAEKQIDRTRFPCRFRIHLLAMIAAAAWKWK